ncbi:hypothetical protein [Blastococcus saxobsidens]|uniref:hypothetical protein n=1 Tax=Blastococcus saxobsidens TaxID=138336 RepID=UPI00102CEF79|nr:hypothetical protein [Blastococcus saxobsidens]
MGALILLLAVVLPLGVALYARYRDADQWLWDDWAALIISMLLGLLFFVLAHVLGRDGERRARAVADAELMTTIGALHMSSARSFAGSDRHALRIAADARAALQHYPNASADEQSALLRTIEDAFSDLAFGTFARADALPRSVWNQLAAGAEGVVAEARQVAAGLGRRAESQGGDLSRLADNVTFALSIGRQVREQHRPPLPPGRPQVLRCVWDGVPPAPETRPDGVESPEQQAARTAAAEKGAADADRQGEALLVRRERLSCLYRRELTVKKDWRVVFDAGDAIACRVVLSDLSGTDHWLAPWYVSDMPPPLHPVNVLFDDLDEAAHHDPVVDRPGLPRFPELLRHGGLPAGMRRRAIANLRDLLRQQEIATVCVLVYDVVTAGGRTQRLVLDGNHRLAAARALAEERRTGWRRRRRKDAATDVRVLAFVMSERRPVDAPASDLEGRFPDWRGFTPDVGLARGTWLPDRYLRMLAGDRHPTQ